MDQVIECPCGTVLRSEGLASVVEQAQQHAREVHDMELPEPDARAMARPA